MRTNRATSIPVRLLTVAAVLALGAISSPAQARTPVSGASPMGTPAVVANAPGNQTDPHVSENLVSYSDFSVTPSRVRYHNLATNIDAAIPSPDGGSDSLSSVSGTTVVYVHFLNNASSFSHSIFSYDTATSGPPVELDPEPGSNRREAAIGGNTVAWQDFGFSAVRSPEMVAYDRNTGATTRLTDDNLFDRDPAVDPSGTVITWHKCTSLALGCNIWDATLQGGVWTTRQLTSDGAADPELGRATNGSIVVYASSRDGESEIRWQPVGGGPEEYIALPGLDHNPSVSADLITFEHYQADAAIANFDIYAYRLSTNTLYRLTSSVEDETLNDVWARPDGLAHAVWSRGDATGDDNVYELSFVVAGRDLAPPTITITAPADHAAYTLNQSVTAGYTCVDEAAGSGTASCQGPVPNGGAVDTASVGTKTFVVTAADNAGNNSVGSATYTVGYRVCPQFDQVHSYRSGRTIPVRLRLCDASGTNLSSPGIAVTATSLVKIDSTFSPQVATDAGNANPDNNFRYDAAQMSYVYNLTTKGLSSGTWELRFTVAGDPIAHGLQFDVA